MRKRTIAAAVAACAVATAAPAGAATRERIVVADDVNPYAFSIDCGDFGPYGFDNVVAGSERVKVTEVRAADGTLLQTVLRFSFRETDTNSATGATLSLSGVAHEVWDHAANTRTISGRVYMGRAPDGGKYIQDTGRIVMTLDTHEPLFVAGPHEGFFGGVDETVCGALATA